MERIPLWNTTRKSSKVYTRFSVVVGDPQVLFTSSLGVGSGGLPLGREEL